MELPLCFKSKSIVLVVEIRNFYDQTRIGDFPDEKLFTENLV